MIKINYKAKNPIHIKVIKKKKASSYYKHNEAEKPIDKLTSCGLKL